MITALIKDIARWCADLRAFLIYYTMEIICKSCGTVGNYRTEKKSNNLVAYCRGCTKFIKNIPYSEPAIYFGKYSGLEIKNFNTPEHINYLHWCRNTPTVWAKFSERVQQAINTQIDGK